MQYEYRNISGQHSLFGLPDAKDNSYLAYLDPQIHSSVIFAEAHDTVTIHKGVIVLAKRDVIDTYAPEPGDEVRPLISGMDNGVHKIICVTENQFCIQSISGANSGKLYLLDSRVSLKLIKKNGE